MENELVRYSRAGDVFHYRWAARRCLRMIYPQSQVRCIVIEGSKESKRAGEYVIDIAEYSDTSKEGIQSVIYYQLKHTTVRKEQPFTLSGLKDTIKGFARRYFEIAAGALKKIDEHAILIIIIDAADNAEMAAKEFSHTCFVHKLLREEVPDGCRLVALCRTEWKHLLQPSPVILQLKLEPFSEEETLIHLRCRFPEATSTDGLEFHRLTGGNPCVQAYALSMGFTTVTETLEIWG